MYATLLLQAANQLMSLTSIEMWACLESDTDVNIKDQGLRLV